MDIPSLKPQSRVPSNAKIAESGAYCAHDTLINGFTSVRSQMCVSHPLEAALKHQKENSEKLKLAFLRSSQGLHAPLKIIHEKNAVKKIQRLPFLPSSNIALETLEGRDEIDLDVFNDPFEDADSLAPPHLVMEKHLFSNL